VNVLVLGGSFAASSRRDEATWGLTPLLNTFVQEGCEMTLTLLRIGFVALLSCLLSAASPLVAAEPEKEYEQFDAGNFDRSEVIDNEWLPLKPGTRFIWDGYTTDEEGDEETRSVVFTVTDLTKVIDGVRTRVCWDRDIVDGELEETEILFVAQDKDRNVWLMGEYPEEYDGDEFVGAPCWIHGIKGAKAGIMMRGDPKLGTPSYSQGWAPAVEFTDRGIVYQVGEKTTVPVGTFDDVLVIDESSKEEPNAHQLKFYARGIGNVRVGWRGEPTDKEELELVKFEQISADELAKAREESLKLEKRAYEISKDVYGETQPSERPAAAGNGPAE
jgi:hypothetical protein